MSFRGIVKQFDKQNSQSEVPGGDGKTPAEKIKLSKKVESLQMEISKKEKPLQKEEGPQLMEENIQLQELLVEREKKKNEEKEEKRDMKELESLEDMSNLTLTAKMDNSSGEAELGLEYGPPVLNIGETGGNVSSRELLRLKKRNVQLEEENNLLRLKVEVIMDMLTETTIDLMDKEVAMAKIQHRKKCQMRWPPKGV